MKRIALMLLVLASASCNTLKTVGATAAAIVVDCGKQVVQQDLLNDATSILASAIADWRTELDMLATQVGRDALACAVAHVAASQAGAAKAIFTAQDTPPVRAAAYLADKNLQPTNVR